MLLFAGNPGFSGTQDVSAVKAMQLFDKGEFEAAENAFKQLLDKTPGNTMLNYYYGASRTENGHYSKEDLNILLEAGQNVTPHRINYYIGIQYHAKNNFDQALKYYNRFRLEVPEEERQKLQLAQKIQQCFDRENPFENFISAQKSEQTKVPEEIRIETEKTVEESLPDSIEHPEILEIMNKNTLPFKPANKNEPDLSELISTPRKMLPDLPGVENTYKLPGGDPIEFRINNEISYLNTAHFKTEKGKEFFLKGKSAQEKVQQNIENADKLRYDYRNTNDAEKKVRIGDQILALENESYELRESVNWLFSQSREYESQYWQNAGQIAVNNFQIELNQMQNAMRPKQALETTETNQFDTSIIITAVDLFNIPDTQSDQPKQKEQNDLVYKIQIGAYSRGLPAYVKRLFDKLSLIRKIDSYTDENGVVVYTTGNLTNLENAIKLQNQVQQEGVEDAFVVPFFKGKRITLEEAKKIEAGNDNERN